MEQNEREFELKEPCSVLTVFVHYAAWETITEHWKLLVPRGYADNVTVLW
jgi:hypothetical protein